MALDEPFFLAVGTEVSAKYKGAFCEAKIRKISKIVKCKVQFSNGVTALVSDETIKGPLNIGASVDVKYSDNKELLQATIQKIQDCSLYTVVFDDGDITCLKRSALCLKSGKHFAASETLDHLPLTHPEHIGTSVTNSIIRGRRSRKHIQSLGESEKKIVNKVVMNENDIGKVICFKANEKKKVKDNWFPGLIVATTVQSVPKINTAEDRLVRSFKDGKYYTVHKKEITNFTKEIAARVENPTLKTAVEKAILYIDKDELPPHWDRDLLFGIEKNCVTTDSEENNCSDNSDDESIEEKDHFVAQLFKFMDDRNTPINQIPVINEKDIDLYRLFKVVNNFGGYNRVNKYKLWNTVGQRTGYDFDIEHIYQQYLHGFEDFYRKLGCTMLSHPRGVKSRNRFSRSIIRDVDKALPSTSSVEKNKSPPSTKQESNEKKDKLEITAKENESNKDPVKSSKTDEKIITTKTTEDVTKKVDVNNMTSRNNRLSVKSNSDIIETKDFKIKKDIKKEKIEIEHENIEDKKVNKKVKTIFAKSIKKKEKKEKIPKVKSTETSLTVAKKITKIKDKIKNLAKGMVPFKKTKNDAPSSDQSDNQFKPDEDVPKLTRSKSKDDLLTKKKLLNLCDSNANNSILQHSNELIIENNSKAKKSVDGNDKKKSVPKIKDKEILNEVTSIPTIPEDLKSEKNTEVTVGANLIVHYGNNHDISYEAKVLNISPTVDGHKFYVHYKGWNSRYDEWVDYKNVTLDVTNNETEDVPKSDQKNTDQKKLPISRTKKSIPTSSNQKKSLFSNTRPTRLCTLNNDQLSSIGKYTIKENSDSENEYSDNLDLVKQDIKKTQQTLKTPKAENGIFIKTEPLDMDSQKKSLYPKTYPSKEMILQRNVPRKPKASVYKAQNNKSNEIEISEPVTLKPPTDFNFEMPAPCKNAKSNINDNTNVKTEIPNKQVKITQNEPKISPIHYLSPKEKLKSYKLNDCKEKNKTIESITLPTKSKNTNVIYYSSSENDEKLKTTTKLSEETSIPLDNKSDKSKISGTDFDLNKIRSEMKGLIPHTVTSSTESTILDQQAEIETLKPIKPVTEDVYEFKESDTDFKIISTVEEKHRRVIKHNDLPKILNFEKTNSLSKGIKSTQNIEVVQHNELFDKDSKEYMVINPIENIISHNSTNNSNQYQNQNVIIDSKQVNDIENSANTDEFDNKAEVLNLCIKQPNSPQTNIFSMPESSESNDVLDDEDDDDTKLVIVDDKICNLTVVENEYNSSKQMKDIQSTSQSSQIYLFPNKDSEFKSLSEPYTNNIPKDLVDDSNTSGKEITQNSPIQSFQMYSQLENQSSLKGYQSYTNECNTKSGVEFELKPPKIGIIKSVESSFKDSIDEFTSMEDPINNSENKIIKDKFNNETSIKIPELQCREEIFEDDNIISKNALDIEYDCNIVKLDSSKNKLCDTRINSNTNCSLEARQSSSKSNNFDIYAPSTSQSILDNNIPIKVLENNSVSNITYCYEHCAPSTSKHNYNSPETNLTNVLFCEETIPGSPNNMLDEEFEQSERKKAHTLYEEHEAASAMYNMNRSFRKPMLTLIGATENEMEQYTNIVQTDGFLDQRHLQFLAEISSRNLGIKLEPQIKGKDPTVLSEQIPEKIEKRVEKSHKRKTSHEHSISKRNKISNANTSTTEINTENSSDTKMSIPLKDDKPIVSFTPDMDTIQRQAVILAKINELRKEYVVVKTRISVVDRRRKKIKKRKRDLAKIAMNQNKPSTSASIAK